MSDFEALSDITLYRMLPPVPDLYIVQNVTLYSVRARLGSAPLLWCAFELCAVHEMSARSEELFLLAAPVCVRACPFASGCSGERG